MLRILPILLTSLCLLQSPPVDADYALGCEDPEYQQYIEQRFAYLEAKNRRLFAETLRDYQLSLNASDNPYQIIGDLSRHLTYSAQFDPIDDANAKIEQIFDHAQALSQEQRIAGYVLDSFSSEAHNVGVARAWIAYRQGQAELAFKELMESIEVSGSAVLGSFGPDFTFIRQIYKDGYRKPVIDYINATQRFWKGRRPDGMRYVWLEMIKAECKIQFDSVDTIKALELGLRVIDVSKDYGISR